MSTQPTPLENEQSADPEDKGTSAETVATIAPAAKAAKLAEASKLFDQLFTQGAVSDTVSLPEGKPHALSKNSEASEVFVRKLVAEPEEHSFQRVIASPGVSTADIPDHFVEAPKAPKEVAAPAPVRHEVEITKLKSHLGAQDIPTAVDAVVSEAEKAEQLVKAKVAKYAAQPAIDFPARVINLKTQNDKLRARLESLE
jgi:hypothetical protein